MESAPKTSSDLTRLATPNTFPIDTIPPEGMISAQSAEKTSLGVSVLLSDPSLTAVQLSVLSFSGSAVVSNPLRE